MICTHCAALREALAEVCAERDCLREELAEAREAELLAARAERPALAAIGAHPDETLAEAVLRVAPVRVAVPEAHGGPAYTCPQPLEVI